VLRRCVTAGWVSFSGADRPVVVLTEEGRAVMKGERPARLLLPPADGGGRAVSPRERPAPKRVAEPTAALDGGGDELFQALRRERLRLAAEERVPTYVIASDRTLREIVALRPRTLDELRMAHGIGPQKAERHGAHWLAVVAARKDSR
jgi:ATP-dependent DNA helicase RecQ